MHLIKHFVTQIGDIETFGLISIALFAATFTGALLRACLMNRKEARAMSELPLQDNEAAPVKKGIAYE